MLAKQLYRLFDDWELTAAVKRAEAILLEDFLETTASKDSTAFRLNGCRTKKKSERTGAAVCGVLNDACSKLDTASMTPGELHTEEGLPEPRSSRGMQARP